MASIDFMTALERETAAMQIVVATADLDAPVPTCPGWSVRDLTVHTGIVHRHKTAVVRDRLIDGPPEEPDAPDGDVIEWFNDGVSEMLSVFRDADLSAPTWTWCGHDHTNEWWIRRMAHETLIHGADAVVAVGGTPEIDEQLAEDGIEEVLVEMMLGAPDWANLVAGDRAIELVTPVRTWVLQTATWSGKSPNTGKVYSDEPGIVLIDSVDSPNAAVTGTAGELDLWLWGRGVLADDAVVGDHRLVAFVRAIAAESTQ